MHPARTQTQSRLGELGLLVEAERALRAPIGALRVLLEGARDGAGPDFAARALAELDLVERAAGDLASLHHPRALRPVRSTLGEIGRSVREHLDAGERQRCHIVIEERAVALEIDGRLLVDALVRCIVDRLRVRRNGEVMLHVHAAPDQATFSLIDADPPEVDAVEDEGDEAPECLAEALLVRDVARLAGRVAIHRAGEHRCIVAVVPKDAPRAEGGEER